MNSNWISNFSQILSGKLIQAFKAEVVKTLKDIEILLQNHCISNQHSVVSDVAVLSVKDLWALKQGLTFLRSDGSFLGFKKFFCASSQTKVSEFIYVSSQVIEFRRDIAKPILSHVKNKCPELLLKMMQDKFWPKLANISNEKWAQFRQLVDFLRTLESLPYSAIVESHLCQVNSLNEMLI